MEAARIGTISETGPLDEIQRPAVKETADLSVDADIEWLAKQLITMGGSDPNTLVQVGQPHVYGTPNGPAFMVLPGAETPLWRLYIPAARAALDLATGLVKAAA